MRRFRLALTGLTLAALVLLGCGADEESATAAPRSATSAPAQAAVTDAPEAAATPDATAAAARERARPGTKVKVVASQFGRILGDGPGRAFYVFDSEQSRTSKCYGACAKAWPPVFARGRPVAGKGVDPELIGTTRRRGGARQVTFRGQPLYYYVHDTPGNVLCHDVLEFGGLWLVIRPDGSRVP